MIPTMNRLLLAALSFPLIAAAPAERRYSVTEFDRIRVSGPYEVVLKTGLGPSARAIADRPSDIDELMLDVEGRELRVRARKPALGSAAWKGPGGGVRIEISTHGIRSAAVTGPGALTIDSAKAQRFVVGLAGSGSITIDRLETDILSLGAAGSGLVRIGEGQAKTATVHVMGSAEVMAPGLATDQLQVDAETAGRIEMNARTSARIRALGAGETRVTGRAACSVDRRGRGPVECGVSAR